MGEDQTTLVTLPGQSDENDVLTFQKQTRLVCFKLEDQQYALEAADTIEILRLVAITGLPQAPNFIPGIINLRGTIIPIVDLRLRFGFRQAFYNLNTPIIVAKNNNRIIGLIVDQVTEVITLTLNNVNSEQIAPKVNYIKGVAKDDDRLLLIVNLNDLLTVEEEKVLKEALGKQDKEWRKDQNVANNKVKELPKTG